MNTTHPQEVIILGGGYGGQMTAARLAQKRLPLRITLVDARPHFVERIRLHQSAASQPIPLRPMADLLAPIGVRFQQGRAVALDPRAQAITLAAPDGGTATLRYDWLILALGSTIDMQSVPGVADHAHSLASPATSERLRDEMAALAQRGGQLLVVGGGLTAIEGATELAERYPGARVTLLTGGALGADLAPAGAAHLRRVLARLGVTVRDGRRVVALHAGAARLADGSEQPFDLCLWAGGYRVPTLAAEAGLIVNGSGQLVTDPTLRAISFSNILAVGDVAQALSGAGEPLRMACATAMPMGAHAAETLARLVRGEEPEPFRFGFVARCISLGRRDGLIQFVTGDDTPTNRIITGRPAAWFKELVCRATVAIPAAERRLGLPLYQWPKPSAAPPEPKAAHA